MPEIKNTFLGGKMNKDLDERLLPKNEYRDALNIEVATSQGDDVGSLQNTWGNTARSNISSVISGGKCIGSIVDKEKDKIYWFISGDNTDAIAEYDTRLRTTIPILIDYGMADTYIQTFGSSDLNPNSSSNTVEDANITNWSNNSPPAVASNLEGSCWIISDETMAAVKGKAGKLKLFIDEIDLIPGYKYEVQYDVTAINTAVNINNLSFALDKHGLDNTDIPLDLSSTGTKKIQWIQGDQKDHLCIYHDSTSVSYGGSSNPFTIDNVKVKQVNRFLNFDDSKYITGINILDGMLFWTDGINEPKKINIERCKAGSYGVANFDSTTFIGSELITNGTFAIDSNWVLDANWEILSGVAKTTVPVDQWSRIQQKNVSIKRGKTYTITMDIGGVFTQGKIGPVIVDEYGGWTKPQSDQHASTTGTHTWTMTSGVTDDNSLSDQNANYIASQFYLQNESPLQLDAGITIDNVSIKEIAFDWNRTTKVKDATGAYSRNIKEEDITLIKKYPLNAPDMELINTTKPKGSIIKTSCTTPINTSYMDKGGGGFLLDGSGDELRYNSFLHFYLSEDTYHMQAFGTRQNRVSGENNINMARQIQFNVGGPDWWDALGTANYGDTINQPVFKTDTDPMGLHESLGQAPYINNSYTRKPNYYQRAWQDWCSLGEFSNLSVWVCQDDGTFVSLNGGVATVDKIGGRIWINSKNQAWVSDSNYDKFQKGKRIVIGMRNNYYDQANNDSFWTYLDGNGNRYVKPAGVGCEGILNADGTKFWDGQGGDVEFEPVVADPNEQYENAAIDFGPGWSVVDGVYVGDSYITDLQNGDGPGGFSTYHSSGPAITQYDSTRRATTTAASSSSTSVDIDDVPSIMTDGWYIVGVSSGVLVGTPKIVSGATGNAGSATTLVLDTAQSFASGVELRFSNKPFVRGWQYLQNVVTNIRQNIAYRLSMRVEIFDVGFEDNGIIGFSALSTNTWSSHGGTVNNMRLENVKSYNHTPGVYDFDFSFTATDLDAGQLVLFKHNQVSCKISNIQVDYKGQSDVKIQPLVFEPKPDYEPGDIVKLTNVKKAPNGDDVTITVKINKEIDTLSEAVKQWEKSPGAETYPDGNMEFTSISGESMYAPEDWITGVTVTGSNMIQDPDAKFSTGAETYYRFWDYVQTTSQQTLGFAFDSGVDLNSGTHATSADWNSNLQMIKNGDFSEVDPDNPNFPRYWSHLDSYAETGTTNVTGWIYHDGFDSGNMGVELHDEANRGHAWENFYQTSEHNPRISFDKNTNVNFSHDISDLTGVGNAGLFMRVYGNDEFKQSGNVTSNGTVSSNLAGPVGEDTDNWNDPYKNEMILYHAQDNPNDQTNASVSTMRVDNISVYANNNDNRLSWGADGFSGIGCVAGNSMQIAGYPANLNGAKVTSITLGPELIVDGTFSDASAWGNHGAHPNNWSIGTDGAGNANVAHATNSTHGYMVQTLTATDTDTTSPTYGQVHPIEGKRYELTYDIPWDGNPPAGSLILANHTTVNCKLNSTTANNNVDLHTITEATGQKIRWLQGDTNTGQIVLYNSTDFNGSIDNISVKEIVDIPGEFKLEKNKYYKMTYQIVATNYDNSTAAGIEECWVKLFDCDAWSNPRGETPLEGNDGHILLDVSAVATEKQIIWKQSHDKTQLELAFGPAWEGHITNIKVYELAITKKDYGPIINNPNRGIYNTTILGIDNNLLQLPLADHKYWECELLDQEPLFKDSFPRFAYRWKYQDGEYSAISAFTEVAFLPNDKYKYDANDGYNLSMENTVRRIILNNFDPPPHGVTELDILYKESNSNSIYTFTTIKGADLQDFKKYEITKEKYHALVESKQLLRPYDNVPKTAVSQEISANRIIFGNYKQQYDITPSDEPIILTNVHSTNIVPSEEVAKSIKSIRQYQVGLSYLDVYGRQSPVFSNDNALIKIDQINCGTANNIRVSLQNFAPDWVTHYKYYVKDIGEPFYNISLDRFWQAENSDHVWLSFPSSDYNKVKEDDYIILKKQHNGDNPIASDITTKYKVLARKGEAPDFIKITRKAVGGKIFNTDGKGLHFFSQASYGGSADGYPQVGKPTFRIKGSVVHADTNKAFMEAVVDDQTGRYIRFGEEISGKPSLFSNYYEVLHVSRTDFGTNDLEEAFIDDEDYYEFTLVQAPGVDASFIGDEYDADRKLFLEYYREELNEFDNDFEGKFFIKIAKDKYFDQNVAEKQKIEDEGYNIVNAMDTYWAHIYENSANNTNTDKGQDTDDWLYDTTNLNWTTSQVDGHANGNNPSSNWDSGNTAGTYNDTGVTYFPALNEATVYINGTSRANPYVQSWEGTWRWEDWRENPDQMFMIDQSWSWNWGSSEPGYIGQDTANTNSKLGNGFVIGNSYCSFKFSGIGNVDFGADEVLGDSAGNITGETDEPNPETSNIDTNTWFDGADKEESSNWFHNYELLSQLKKPGTQFRWRDDPSKTIYTITKVMHAQATKNYHHRLPDGSYYGSSGEAGQYWASQNTDGSGNRSLRKEKDNFSYRIDLQLDKPIVWSPTATITAGLGWNVNNDHTTLLPWKESQTGTSSQIQIVERRPSESTYSSFNPAVFEVVPKERADLNLYYETPKVGMILKDGMYIEALNNSKVNDSNTIGGNYTTESDIGTVYKPGGHAALPYVYTNYEEKITNYDFSSVQTAPTELVTNGTFDSDISGWSEVAGAEAATTATYDSAEMRVAASGDHARMTQEVTGLTIGKTYIYSYDCVSGSGNFSHIGTTSGASDIKVNVGLGSTGTHTTSFDATTTSVHVQLGVTDGNTVDFDNVSLKEQHSGVNNWTILQNMSGTHDAVDNTLTVNWSSTAESTAGLESDLITLEDNEQYRLVVNVLDIDGNIAGSGSGTPTTPRVVIVGMLNDGTWNSAGYYPNTAALQIGLNQWTFSVDSTLNQNSSNFVVKIEFYDPDQGYDKMIKLKTVSLNTSTEDYDKPITKIQTGEKFDWCENPNQVKIYSTYWNDSGFSEYIGQNLPEGITIRISERDENNKVSYYKDYILNQDLTMQAYGESEIWSLPQENLLWHNCFSFGNGVESLRLRDDFNAVSIDKGPRVSTTFEESYREETLGSGMIFSGIYNSTSSVNQLNQFIQAEAITKDLNPEYGSIQKLFTRNTNVVAFCENKVLKVLANKDAVYNADGQMQVTHTKMVLGQAIPFVGEYGISRNPESFANFGYRVYFADRDRGAILRLSADGLTPISDKDMISYFKYNLPNSNNIIGSYDENRDTYNVTLDTTTVSFSEKVNGWTSFKSFLLESGASINGEYYTWKNGDIWAHHTNTLRNNFYNTQYESSVKFVFNDEVDMIKNFNTLNYEGTTSRIYEDETGEENQLITKGWYTNYIKTDLETAEIVNFKDKEGKWFNNITGISKTEEDINLKDFTSQGLGLVESIEDGGHDNYKTLLIKAYLPPSIPEVNAENSGSGVWYNDTVNTVTTIPYPTDITYTSAASYNSITGWKVQTPTEVRFQTHSLTVPNADIDGPQIYYMTSVITNLTPGDTYYVEADVTNMVPNTLGTTLGFSSINMENIQSSQNQTGDGKIHATFTYTPSAGDLGEGIHLYKNYNLEGIIKNIRCINITSKPEDSTYTVNTSLTDRTQTTTELKNNLLVGNVTQTDTYYFYIHSQTVGGIKYAVNSSAFVVISSNAQIVVGTLEDMGSGTNSAGYYGNVVRIPLIVTFNSNNPFPNENIESYININGRPTLAIDQ